jgi:hypothetical protein
MPIYEFQCMTSAKKEELLMPYSVLSEFLRSSCDCGGLRVLLPSLPGKAQWLVDTGTASSPFKEKSNG